MTGATLFSSPKGSGGLLGSATGRFGSHNTGSFSVTTGLGDTGLAGGIGGSFVVGGATGGSTVDTTSQGGSSGASSSFNHFNFPTGSGGGGFSALDFVGGSTPSSGGLTFNQVTQGSLPAGGVGLNELQGGITLPGVKPSGGHG